MRVDSRLTFSAGSQKVTESTPKTISKSTKHHPNRVSGNVSENRRRKVTKKVRHLRQKPSQMDSKSYQKSSNNHLRGLLGSRGLPRGARGTPLSQKARTSIKNHPKQHGKSSTEQHCFAGSGEKTAVATPFFSFNSKFEIL